MSQDLLVLAPPVVLAALLAALSVAVTLLFELRRPAPRADVDTPASAPREDA